MTQSTDDGYRYRYRAIMAEPLVATWYRNRWAVIIALSSYRSSRMHAGRSSSQQVHGHGGCLMVMNVLMFPCLHTRVMTDRQYSKLIVPVWPLLYPYFRRIPRILVLAGRNVALTYFPNLAGSKATLNIVLQLQSHASCVVMEIPEFRHQAHP